MSKMTSEQIVDWLNANRTWTWVARHIFDGQGSISCLLEDFTDATGYDCRLALPTEVVVPLTKDFYLHDGKSWFHIDKATHDDLAAIDVEFTLESLAKELGVEISAPVRKVLNSKLVVLRTDVARQRGNFELFMRYSNAVHFANVRYLAHLNSIK